MLRFIAALLAAVSISAPALAQNYLVKDANAATITMCSELRNGVQLPCHVVPDVSGSGTLNGATVNSAIVIPIKDGQATAALSITGLSASHAVLMVEASNDNGVTYRPSNEIPLNGSLQSTITTDGNYFIIASGRTQIELVVATAGLGNVSVSWNLSVAPGRVNIGGGVLPDTLGGDLAALHAISTQLKADLDALSATNASFSGPIQIAVGGAPLATAVRDIDAECTAAGTATVTFAGGGSIVWQVKATSQDKVWQATGVASVAGGAVCTFYGLY